MSALETPNGALPNERIAAVAARPRHRTLRPQHGKIVVVQPAAHDWRCDGCRKPGYGGVDLLEHFRETGHRFYTPMA